MCHKPAGEENALRIDWWLNENKMHNASKIIMIILFWVKHPHSSLSKQHWLLHGLCIDNRSIAVRESTGCQLLWSSTCSLCLSRCRPSSPSKPPLSSQITRWHDQLWPRQTLINFFVGDKLLTPWYVWAKLCISLADYVILWTQIVFFALNEQSNL